MAIVPTTSGMPTSPNSKNPNSRPPAAAAASFTMTFTGVPVRASIDPAWAPNTSGISSCDGERPSRTAMTTMTGSSAATAPFTLIRAVSPATSSIIRTMSRVRLSPTWAMRICPAQVVTPVASRPSLTTNRVAMKMTAGSPNPASAWVRSRTPVKYSASDAPIATSPTGIRFETNARTTASRIANVIAMSLTPDPAMPAADPSSGHVRWTGAPGPSGIPMTNQTTRKTVHASRITIEYGIISDTIVPTPAVLS